MRESTRTSRVAFILILCAFGRTSYADPPVTPTNGRDCRGLSAAVVRNDVARLKSLLESGCNPNHVGTGINPLEVAMARGRVDATRLLLEVGADPNARDHNGRAIVQWLGSGRGYTDDNLLQVAQLLESHGCKFEDGGSPGSVDLLTNLAWRRVPKTLAFLASKSPGNDPSRALKAIARGDDIDSVQALLAAGADPLRGVAKTSALLDAARAGRTASVTAMLQPVKNMEDPKVLVAYQAAVQQGHRDTAQVFVANGFKIPQPPPPVRPRCQPRELTPDMKALLRKMGLPNTSGLLGLAGGMNCKLIQECGELINVDCNSAADGPAYYINRSSAQLLATCGGACMRGCTNCPPKEWTCSCN